MKIGILTYHFPPEPAFIPGSLAEELAARGHQVRVLTGFPDYPGGQLYPGWRQSWRHETSSERLSVRRVPRYYGNDAARATRIAGYLSFAGSVALVGPRFFAGIDVLYVHQSPATTFAAAGLVRLLRQVPVLLHVQQFGATEALAGTGGVAARWEERLATVGQRLRHASTAIAVTAPSMRQLVFDEGVDPQKVRVVLNWTDERIFQPGRPTALAARLMGRNGRSLVMHAGSLGPDQRLETAVRAAAAVRATVDLVLVGAGAEERRLRQLAADLDAPNVRFVARRSPLEMADLYAAADYQLVCQRDLPVLRGAVPGKLQAAFSCASPVIASAAGDTVEIVERSRAGLSCPPEDWSALADRFWLAATIPADARREMGQRGRQAYQARMSRRAGVDQIESLLYATAERSVSPTPIGRDSGR